MREFVSLTKASKALSVETINAHLSQLKGWYLSNYAGRQHIFCHYQFDNFNESMNFANQLARLADHYNHHPTLVVKWGCTDVYWCTYQLKGIHENDFFMAQKCDELFQNRR